MLKIIDMTENDIPQVLDMAKKFYNSNAVDHSVDERILIKTVKDACSNNPLLKGVILKEDDKVIGYAYITSLYACECAGETVLVEELFLNEDSRGKGCGKEFFKWLFKTYSGAVRFRLEVTRENKRAYKLYKNIGFKELAYLQMVYDIETAD